MATRNATKRFLDESGRVGRSFCGIHASLIGLGTKNLREGMVKAAINCGVNIIDTSGNFMNGQSEEMIGKELLELFKGKSVKREELILMSKAGYVVNGEYPGMVRFDRSQSHCIHPTFLRPSLEKSLERLQVDSLDVFFINSPERMISKMPLSQLHDQLLESFVYLEERVKKGHIGCYGICSTSMALFNSSHHIDIGGLLERAKQNGCNNLKVLQYPFNLIETEAYPELTNLAKENNMYCFTHRPLTALFKDSVQSLAHIPVTMQDNAAMNHLSLCFQDAIELEQEIDFATCNHAEMFLEHVARILSNYHACLYYLDRQFIPSFKKQVNEMIKEVEEEETLIVLNYEKCLDRLSEAVKSVATIRSNQHLQEIELHYQTFAKTKHVSLSHLSIKACIEANNGSVLIGAQSKEDIRDALEAAECRIDLNLQNISSIRQYFS